MLGSFVAALYVSLGGGYTVFFRYVLPLVPIACLSAAVAVRHAAGWMAQRASLSNAAALGILVTVTAVPGFVNSVCGSTSCWRVPIRG